jgi:hypothetical protein
MAMRPPSEAVPIHPSGLHVNARVNV